MEMQQVDMTKSDYLPQVRCTEDLKERLRRVAAHSVSPRLTDHILAAVREYVAQQEQTLGIRQN